MRKRLNVDVVPVPRGAWWTSELRRSKTIIRIFNKRNELVHVLQYRRVEKTELKPN